MTSNVETLKQQSGRNGSHVTDADSKKTRKSWSLTALLKTIDKNMSESVTLSKSMLWIIGAGVLILQLSLNYGGSLISWARADQTNVEAIQSMKAQLTDIKTAFAEKNNETREDVKELKRKFENIEKGFQEMEKLKIKIDTAEQLLKGQNNGQ